MKDDANWNRFLTELREKNDIVEVISSYIEVKPKGRGYWALCPFHNDRNPSLSINRSGQYFHCFVCGKGGDIVRFVMNYESCSYMEAIESLAKRAGLQIPNRNGYDDELISKRRKERDIHLKICRETARFYHATLMSERGSTAKKYLLDRGLTQATMTRFGLGYSPDWDSLHFYLREKGFNHFDMHKAGVLNETRNKRYYDPLCERVIVPILNLAGDVIAFGGRILNNDSDAAKYKNTVMTDVFDKSKNLFAINLVKKRKQEGRLEYIIIVEGYMDVIALHQAGIDMAVASMGTALTAEQARLAARLTNNVFICYDGDSAGQAATLRGLDILRNEGLNVRVMTMPNGIDPDDFVRQRGADAFNEVVGQALPLTEYKLLCAGRECGMDTAVSAGEKREAFKNYARKAIQILRPLDSVEQDSYLRLVHEQTGLAYDMLKRDMKKNYNSDDSEKTDVHNVTESIDLFNLVTAEDRAAYFVLASYLLGKQYAGEFSGFETDNPFFRSVENYLCACKAEGRSPVMVDLYSVEGMDGFSEELVRLLSVNFSDTDADEKYFRDCLGLLEKSRLNAKIKALNDAYVEEKDAQKRNAIAMELASLARKRTDKTKGEE